MGKSFTEFRYDDAVDLVGRKAALPTTGTRIFFSQNLRRPPSALAATDFYDGDHWQESRGFIGQLPPKTLPGAAQILTDIQNAFVSENVIQEVVETHTGGILGREPAWSFLKAEIAKGNKPTDKERDLETGDTLTPWWNKRNSLRDLQKAVTILLSEGIAVRRLFFPRGRLVNDKIPSQTDISKALEFIYFETVTADIAGVFRDQDTQADIGIFLYEERDAEGTVQDNCAELSFLNDRDETVVRIVKERGQSLDLGPYQLGGHLLVYELKRRPLITEQVQSNQRALNLAHTMMMRNVNMAGARERTVTNAQPPVNLPGKDVHEGRPTVYPGTYKTGAGAVNFLMGVPIYDDQGNISGYTNPNVNISEPSSVETFERTIANEKQAIYSQCHQRHVLIVDKADTSGRAREVARREFERSLKETKTVVDASGRWVLETALRLAAQVANQTRRYANLRADFNCIIDAGEPDPEKQKTALEMRKPGGPLNKPLISEETARNWIGVEDPAAELAKIEAEGQEAPADLPPSKSPEELQQPTETPADTVN